MVSSEQKITGVEPTEESVRQVLTHKVNPILAEHFGEAVLTGLHEGVASVKLQGACAGCPSAQETMNDVVKAALMEAVPDLKDVVLDTSVSPELMEMARQILSGNLKPERRR